MVYSKFFHKNYRRAFDPAKVEDQMELKFFLENRRWKNGCPFEIEYPWEDIPAMCKEKYALYKLQEV
jgi:hypothetical protein